MQHLRLALGIDPDSEETHRVLGLAYMQAGKYEAAEEALREAVRLAEKSKAYSLATLGHLAARTGQRATAERAVEELAREERAGQYVSPVALATLYLGLERFDMVFDALERAFLERRGWLAYLKVEPLLDPLRGDERLHDLVRRMRLP